MTNTTIKVSTVTRDRLKAQASAAHRSLGAYLEDLAEMADRRARFAALRESIDATPADLAASYRAELLQWEGVSDELGAPGAA